MDDLVEWLRVQIAEDEQTATAIFRDHTWSAYPEGGNDGWAVEGAHSGEPSCVVGDEAMAAHIARFDPKRMLDEVEAKRKIIGWLESKYGTPQESGIGGALTAVMADAEVTLALKVLAVPYSGRPGYREVWRP